MINEQAANAFKTAKILTALYTRLDLAREAINLALESLPHDFDTKTTKQIFNVAKMLNHEMRGIWDLRESEERRICQQPDATPENRNNSQDKVRNLFGGWTDEILREFPAPTDENPDPRIPGHTTADDQYPPLADPDSLPDPPVLAGPDDNTPNFIQIDLPKFF